MNQQEMEFLATLAERGFEHVRATDVGSRVEAQRFSTGLPPDRRADFWAGWGKGEGKARRRAKSAAKPIVKNGDARPAAPELLPQESPASKPRVAPADGRATVTSAPDRPIHVTILADRTGVKVHRTEMTLDELRQAILDTSAPAKDQLYWLKLARFGGKRSPRGSLRTNDNVLAISGVELDYDGKVMSFDEAVRIANAARLKCILYTTPSYTDAEPKWRVLAPTSQELAPSERVRLAARINGVFGGIFAPESFVLSQGFIFGSVNHNPAHRAVIVEGEFVDDRDDLDAIAIGKDNGAESIDPSCDDAPGELQAPIELVAAALAVIPNTDPSWIFWNRIAMAIFGATAGDNAGFDLFDRWSQKWSGYSERDTAARWQALRRSPPDKIGAGTLFFLADEIDPRWRDRRDAATGDEATAVNEAPASETKPAASAAPAVKKKPTATAEFFDPWERYAVPAFPFEVLPEVLRTFIADQSEVIGCDPSALAMSALGVVGGAITHELKLRMNQHDNGAFTVSTCLWVLLIADSGTKKTPLLSTTAMPLIKAHADEMKRYAALLAEWEADESNNKGPQPIEPAGYVIHDTTVEALGIALSHSDRGILVYADELSGWIEAM